MHWRTTAPLNLILPSRETSVKWKGHRGKWPRAIFLLQTHIGRETETKRKREREGGRKIKRLRDGEKKCQHLISTFFCAVWFRLYLVVHCEPQSLHLCGGKNLPLIRGVLKKSHNVLRIWYNDSLHLLTEEHERKMKFDFCYRYRISRAYFSKDFIQDSAELDNLKLKATPWVVTEEQYRSLSHKEAYH